MKKILNYFLVLFVAVALFSSCKKDNSVNGSSANLKPKKLDYAYGEGSPTNPGGGTNGAVYVYQDANTGEFYSPWGPGIGFGTYFPHPAVVDETNEGTAFYPGVSATDYFTHNLLSFGLNGNKFTALYGTFVGGLPTNYHDAETAYYQAFNAYLTDSTAGLPVFSAAVAGASSTGIITVFGQFVVDSNSPTHVSIVPITNTLFGGLLVE